MATLNGQQIIGLMTKARLARTDELTIKENGTYKAKDHELDGFSEIVVDVPNDGSTLLQQEKIINQNGVFTPDENYDGMYSVKVNVPTYITVESEDDLPETAEEGTIAIISEV